MKTNIKVGIYGALCVLAGAGLMHLFDENQYLQELCNLQAGIYDTQIGVYKELLAPPTRPRRSYDYVQYASDRKEKKDEAMA